VNRKNEMWLNFIAVFTGFILALTAVLPATADQENPPFFDWNYSITVIVQHLFPFTSPYIGANSLLSRSETETTNTDLLSLQFHPFSNLKLQFDYQSARGLGVGNPNSTGLAGYVNGDVIRISKVGTAPYWARFFLEWQQPLHKNSSLVVDFGKMSIPDFFDTNRYANSVDTQFLNWGFINNLAYDYAADTRGYSGGFVLQWMHSDWALKAGTFQMPTFANGPILSNDWPRNQGDQIEFDKMIGNLANPTIVRFFVYENLAHMGNYEKAVQVAEATNTIPNIVNTETIGAKKYGFGLNFELPLGDNGNTGIFGRFGWNDDHTEDFAYTEAGQSASLGAQISGMEWGIPNDLVGIGIMQNKLSYFHREYLALGGYGFQLGDGKLSYAPEVIFETYYAHSLVKGMALTLDYQWIANPGYNSARGPVSILGIRLHMSRF
jgi:high affinity Mn2+ porin